MTTKEKVLEILTKKSGDSIPISGEKLAEACGVSRAAIWKAMNSLREEGCQIEGTTNGGYILQGSADIFSKENLELFLAKKYPNLAASPAGDTPGCKVECFKTIDSTNTYAKQLLSHEPARKLHNKIIVAESQTAGRGRLGRTFVSPAKTGIYITVIFAPAGGITEPAKITAFAAVAICRVIQRLYNISPKIKWINDIFINGHKVAGILTEGTTNFETGSIDAAVIGMGINISDNQELFAAHKIAGSITGSQGAGNRTAGRADKPQITRSQLAAEIAGETLSILEEDSATVMAEYKAHSFLIGQTVKVHPIIGDDKSIYEAKVLDIDHKAGLVVQLKDGSKKTLSSGEVSLHSEEQRRSSSPE